MSKIIGVTVGTPINPSQFGGGYLNITDDNNGNVTVVLMGTVSIRDDGNGNVTIG